MFISIFCVCNVCVWESESVFISSPSKLCLIFQPRSRPQEHTHKQVHPSHHREISHLSNLNHNQQINGPNILLGWLVKVSVKGLTCVSSVELPLTLIVCERKTQRDLNLFTLSHYGNVSSLRGQKTSPHYVNHYISRCKVWLSMGGKPMKLLNYKKTCSVDVVYFAKTLTCMFSRLLVFPV